MINAWSLTLVDSSDSSEAGVPSPFPLLPDSTTGATPDSLQDAQGEEATEEEQRMIQESLAFTHIAPVTSPKRKHAGSLSSQNAAPKTKKPSVPSADDAVKLRVLERTWEVDEEVLRGLEESLKSAGEAEDVEVAKALEESMKSASEQSG